jgi:hypothetical protein
MAGKDPKKLEDVRDVLNRNKKELMKRFSAEGVAIGKRNPTDDSYVLTIFLDTSRDIPTEPAEIEGIPLKFEITGKFKAQE